MTSQETRHTTIVKLKSFKTVTTLKPTEVYGAISSPRRVLGGVTRSVHRHALTQAVYDSRLPFKRNTIILKFAQALSHIPVHQSDKMLDEESATRRSAVLRHPVD